MWDSGDRSISRGRVIPRPGKAGREQLEACQDVIEPSGCLSRCHSDKVDTCTDAFTCYRRNERGIRKERARQDANAREIGIPWRHPQLAEVWRHIQSQSPEAQAHSRWRNTSRLISTVTGIKGNIFAASVHRCTPGVFRQLGGTARWSQLQRSKAGDSGQEAAAWNGNWLPAPSSSSLQEP